jgi:predicted neuraminidase
LVALPAQHRLASQKSVLAFWFAGERESAPDVQIAMSMWDSTTQQWDAPQWVLSRESVRQALGVQVRRLGNPVAWADAQGRVHVFVVATGLGGWAASRVVHLIERPVVSSAASNDSSAPLTFDIERILPLMPSVPMFNTSVLVRALPVPLQDGGALLPVYFEIGRKYPIALRLDPQGQMQGWVRMSERQDVLQPSVVALSETQWLALMRDSGAHGHVALSVSEDAGAHWQDLPDDTLGNPDSSVAVLRVGQDIWLAHNPKAQGRRVLELSRSPITQTTIPTLSWQTQTLAQGVAGQEFSYPSMMLREVKGQAPEVWMSYTHLRSAIAYQRWQLSCSSTHKGGQ